MKFAILLTLSTLMTSHAYNVLVINTVPTKSHYLLMNGIADILMDGGHEVTLITPSPSKNPRERLKQIDVSDAEKILHDADENGLFFSVILNLNRGVGVTIAQSPEVRKTLIEEQFDAVISDWFYADPEDAGYAAVQQVPWILLSGPVLEPFLEDVVDTARSVPIAPLMYNFVKEPMSFWNRILNTLWHLRVTYEMSQWHKVAEVDYQENFGPIAKARGVTLPPFSEVKYNVSVIFVNQYAPVAPVRSLPPNIVEVGGYHIPKEVPPLPKDLQEIMDSSKNGVIYFSLGSWYLSSLLPNQTKADLVKLFAQLPYTVLWKFEDTLEDRPENLHIRPWMPQSSILAHPKLKVFITHAGLLSTLETHHFGVPTISIPTFGDQYNNALRSEYSGLGIQVGLSDLARDLEVALRKMLADDSYQRRAKELSEIFNNRPVSPSTLILHHVEQAIRTKGSHHLRSRSQLYTWYQVWMLDQLAFFLAVVYVLYRSGKVLLNKTTATLNSYGVKLKQQ